jgi:hypothetical protein
VVSVTIFLLCPPLSYIQEPSITLCRFRPLSHSWAAISVQTNSFIILYPWLPLWSSVQSSWLQIQRSGFHSRSYESFWVVVGLERGPLSLVSTVEELTEWYVQQRSSVFQWCTNLIFKYYLERNDRLCGLVVRVPGYRPRGRNSIPSAPRGVQTIRCWTLLTMDSLCAFRYKSFRNTRHTVTLGIPLQFF